MYYCQEIGFDGKPRSVTYDAKPPEGLPEGGVRKFITPPVKVPEHLRKLTLQQLDELFGRDGRFTNTGGKDDG